MLFEDPNANEVSSYMKYIEMPPKTASLDAFLEHVVLLLTGTVYMKLKQASLSFKTQIFISVSSHIQGRD